MPLSGHTLGYSDTRRQLEKQISSDLHGFSWAPILRVHLGAETLESSLSQMANWHHLLAGPVNMHPLGLRVHSQVTLVLEKISVLIYPVLRVTLNTTSHIFFLILDFHLGFEMS